MPDIVAQEMKIKRDRKVNLVRRTADDGGLWSMFDDYMVGNHGKAATGMRAFPALNYVAAGLELCILLSRLFLTWRVITSPTVCVFPMHPWRWRIFHQLRQNRPGKTTSVLPLRHEMTARAR